MTKYPRIPGYRIIRELGKGGMARIYLAYDEKVEREVALKVLLRKLIEDEEITRRFLREAKTAARLEHTNIVAIYDVGQFKDFYYFTMEFLEGSLKGKVLEPPAALDIIKQIAGALRYAHSEGFIHRDIKPENILFRKDGTPVLVDFGIVRAADSTTRLTKTGVAIGTPFYMSPEQIGGLDIDCRADLYSLGVVLYEILTGQVPYGGTDVISISLKHLNEPIPKLAEHFGRYQPLVDALMAKDREERIQDADELIAAIDTYNRGNEKEYFKSREIFLENAAKGKKIPGTGHEQGERTIADRSIRVKLDVKKSPSRKWKFPLIWPVIFVFIIAIGLTGYFLYHRYNLNESPHSQAEPAKDAAASRGEVKAPDDSPPENTAGKEQEQAFNNFFSSAVSFYRKGNYEAAKQQIVLAKAIKNTPELIRFEKEIDKKITEKAEQAGLAREKSIDEQNETDDKVVVEYLKLKEKPSFISAIETKAEKVSTNKKGYWEAVFFNETVMVYVPGGDFMMGANGGEPDQRPAHTVYLDGYWIAKYEVAFDQYDRYCAATGEKKVHDRGWGRSKRPVINIPWRSARQYCEWLSRETGLIFTLPTEAQWEKAARGMDARMYPWGDAEPDKINANYRNDADGNKYTAPVGSYPTGESSYGILDLAGNVWEWCRDWYEEDYYAASPTRNPGGPLRGSFRVVRGGSWNDGKRYIRALHRAGSSPSSHDPYTGFRVALESTR